MFLQVLIEALVKYHWDIYPPDCPINKPLSDCTIDKWLVSEYMFTLLMSDYFMLIKTQWRFTLVCIYLFKIDYVYKQQCIPDKAVNDFYPL